MGKYILKRLLTMILVVIGVAITIFTVMWFVPGDPVMTILGSSYNAELYAETAHKFGLDQPYLVQLGTFLKQVFLHFDFGTSLLYGKSVTAELMSRLPRTLMIGGIACVLEIVIALPLGVTAALHHNKILDRLCVLLAMLAISLPNFWVAMMMIVAFSLKLHWLPSSGVTGWMSYIMPCFACCLMSLGGETRQVRSQMLEVMRSDYVVTARAKGVPERQIVLSHMLPNALIPVVANIGSHLGMAIGGTVIIETVFAIPGVGVYMMEAMGNRDFPIVRGGVTLLSILFCLVVILTDLTFAFIDPRIKAQYEGQNKKKLSRSLKEEEANANA